MRNKPLLTVAIPTYNRAHHLGKILSTLSREDSSLFEVVISDNASTDTTEKTVAEYTNRKPNIRYHKNSKNIGYSANIIKLYQLSTTRYIWYLGDDETVEPGAIKKIVSALKEYTPVVALFNTTWIDPYGIKRTAGVKRTEVHSDLKTFDDYTPIMRTTFLSIIVVEKRLSDHEVGKLLDKNNIFIQITLCLKLLSEEFRLVEVGETVVHRNVGYKYGEFIKLNLIDQIAAAHKTEHIFSNSKLIDWARKQIPSVVTLYLSQKLGLFSYTGKPTRHTIQQLIRYYGLHALPVLILPFIYIFVPKILLEKVYLQKLTAIHGEKKGRNIFETNINRVRKDNRSSGFL